MGNGASNIKPKSDKDKTVLQNEITQKTLDLRGEFFTEPIFTKVIKYGNFSANVFGNVDSYDLNVLNGFKNEFKEMGYNFNWNIATSVSPWYVSPHTNEIVNEEYIFTCSKIVKKSAPKVL
jgi:hypothetical protein